MSERPSSPEEVGKVHQYIEFCIMHYKTKSQTVDIVARQADIHPVFTETIWEELERQNPDFFSAYYTRLALMDQIARFNSLLSVQEKMMQQEEETSSITEGADLMMQLMMQNCNNGPQQQDEGHSSASQPNGKHDSNKGNRNTKSEVQRRSTRSKKPSTNGRNEPRHS